VLIFRDGKELKARPRCTKCNSSPINGQCTNHRIGPLLCGFSVHALKGSDGCDLEGCHRTACLQPWSAVEPATSALSAAFTATVWRDVWPSARGTILTALFYIRRSSLLGYTQRSRIRPETSGNFSLAENHIWCAKTSYMRWQSLVQIRLKMSFCTKNRNRNRLTSCKCDVNLHKV